MPSKSYLWQALTALTFKSFILLLIASLVLAGCDDSAQPTMDKANAQSDSSVSKSDSETQAQQMATQSITILALGDSLTEGLGVAEQDAYPAQLQAVLEKAGYANVQVINAGLSGETSTGLVNRLDWVIKTNPDITILTTGANDAMRGIDISVIEDNIRTAILRLQAEGSLVVLSGMQIYDNLGEQYVTAFSDIYPKLADETGVAFIPFFLQGVGGDAQLNQADRIHPTKEGYAKIISDNILPVLEPVLRKLKDEASTGHDQSKGV